MSTSTSPVKRPEASSPPTVSNALQPQEHKRFDGVISNIYNHHSHAHFHEYQDHHFQESLAAIRSKLPGNWSPDIGIVCGSGLGGLGAKVDAIPGHHKVEISYSTIPHFAQTTVSGHAGKLVFGQVSGKNVVCMVGRFHSYEGLALYQTTYPIRIFALLGIKTLIVTNAAGSLNHDGFDIGSIMVIKDHLNLPGLSGHNPLMGRNLDVFGPRFPATSDAYDLELRRLAIESFKAIGEPDSGIRQGTYVFVAGPSYETPAEARFLKLMGADAVGMSTIPEVIVARHSNIRVLGLSLITNKVVMPEEMEFVEKGGHVEKATHEEVLRTSNQKAKVVEALVERIVMQIKINSC